MQVFKRLPVTVSIGLVGCFTTGLALHSSLEAKPFQRVDHLKHQAPGMVHDEVSGLVWMRCSAGQLLDQGLCRKQAVAMDWHKARRYCKTLKLAGREWRLPGVSELLTIVDMNRDQAPYIDLKFFSIATRAEYWTSAVEFDERGPVYRIINFQSGGQTGASSKQAMYVRCVSGGSR